MAGQQYSACRRHSDIIPSSPPPCSGQKNYAPKQIDEAKGKARQDFQEYG